jgi:ribosome-associated protein YbcJ (S4-like RNA binding protein)
MSFILNLIYKIISLFHKEKEIEQQPLIIHPIRFQGLKKEESTRTKDESLQLVKSFEKAEKSKQEGVAKNTKDPIIQKGILEYGNIDLIIILASNPWLDEEIQYILATDKKWDDKAILASLARKINLTVEVQKILATSDKVEIRKMLARWQRPINPAIAKIMIKDNEIEVRKSIAMNIGEKIRVENIVSFKGGEEDIQLKMIQDQDSEIRRHLALNKNLTKKAQLSLAKKCMDEKEWSSLKLLAENENLHTDSKTFMLESLKDYWPNFNAASISKILKEKLATSTT